MDDLLFQTLTVCSYVYPSVNFERNVCIPSNVINRKPNCDNADDDIDDAADNDANKDMICFVDEAIQLEENKHMKETQNMIHIKRDRNYANISIDYENYEEL